MTFPTNTEILQKEADIASAFAKWLLQNPQGGVFVYGWYELKVTRIEKKKEPKEGTQQTLFG